MLLIITGKRDLYILAHNELDKAVDLAYRKSPFTTEALRLEYLFELHEQYTADLFTQDKIKRKNKTLGK